MLGLGLLSMSVPTALDSSKRIACTCGVSLESVVDEYCDRFVPIAAPPNTSVYLTSLPRYYEPGPCRYCTLSQHSMQFPFSNQFGEEPALRFRVSWGIWDSGDRIHGKKWRAFGFSKATTGHLLENVLISATSRAP